MKPKFVQPKLTHTHEWPSCLDLKISCAPWLHDINFIKTSFPESHFITTIGKTILIIHFWFIFLHSRFLWSFSPFNIIHSNLNCCLGHQYPLSEGLGFLPSPILIQFSANVTPGGGSEGSSHWSLSPTWDNQIEFLATGFSLALPWLLWLFRKWTRGWKICLCYSAFLSFLFIYYFFDRQS